MLPAAADGAAIVNADVAAFAGGSSAPVKNLAVENDSCADARAESGVENGGIALASAPARFGEARGVGVIIERCGDAEFLADFLGQREVAPAGKVGRIDDDACLGI